MESGCVKVLKERRQNLEFRRKYKVIITVNNFTFVLFLV